VPLIHINSLPFSRLTSSFNLLPARQFSPESVLVQDERDSGGMARAPVQYEATPTLQQLLYCTDEDRERDETAAKGATCTRTVHVLYRTVQNCTGTVQYTATHGRGSSVSRVGNRDVPNSFFVAGRCPLSSSCNAGSGWWILDSVRYEVLLYCTAQTLMLLLALLLALLLVLLLMPLQVRPCTRYLFLWSLSESAAPPTGMAHPG
jgi:hypothetical protein